MEYIIKIKIIGNKVSLDLLDDQEGIISGAVWIDERDLSDRLLSQIEKILKKNNIALKSVRKFDFDCDCPYFRMKKDGDEIKLEEVDSSGKCGFTTWQTGEIITSVLNFAIAE